ncbi:DinB family protein [Roseivirga sp. UBA838]|uniref:DinB family protein n=1 Tax=Roseivirga sp. UBA838 TaxID=1947393 RepID=UPI002580AB51|nr:DinB family protein [Roseivirga sp. UBA838]|tara:strand:+ start:3353 stop:3799 length:447 start_codon:yes stop_codon:yes gene_type:complete
MKERFTRLFEYNLWANGQLAESLRVNPIENDKVLKLTSHLANAQVIWLDRVQGQSSTVGVWDEYSQKETLELLERSSQDWLDFLYSAEDLEKVIEYKNSKGQTYESRIEDILNHVVNHSTHHRAQVMLLLRQENIDPPSLDFIFYVRS